MPIKNTINKVDNKAGTSALGHLSLPEISKSTRDTIITIIAVLISSPEILSLAHKLYNLVYAFHWDWVIAWNLLIVSVKVGFLEFGKRLLRDNR